MPRDDSGPAFPTTPLGETIGGVTGGMSLRDWFAGQALASEAPCNRWEFAAMAEWAYRYADAMLAEREGAKEGER